VVRVERLLLYLAVAAAVLAALTAARLRQQPDYCSEARRLAAAALACDALSELLGGPSIAMRFMPSRWRGVYWGVAVGAILGGIASLVSGRELAAPGSAFLGKYELVLSLRRKEVEALRRRFPSQGRFKRRRSGSGGGSGSPTGRGSSWRSSRRSSGTRWS